MHLTPSQASPGFTCLQYKTFENVVAKAEIACNKQFLLFHIVFYSCEELSSKFEIVVCKLFQFGGVDVWERVKNLRSKAVEKIVRKGEIACNKQCLLFSQCFLPSLALNFHFKCT